MSKLDSIIHNEKFNRRNKLVLKVIFVSLLFISAYYVYAGVNSNTESKNSYIKDIVYKKKTTNKNIQVAFDIQGETKENKLSVIHNGKKITVEKEKNIYFFIANENGEYQIKYGDFKKEISINNIDKENPILENINKDSGLLTFKLSDRGSGIDYDKTYIDMEDTKIKLLSTEGDIGVAESAITKKAVLILYDKAGNFSSFDIDVEEISE